MNLQQITQQQNLDRPKTHKLRDVYKRAGLQRSLAGQRDRIRRLTRTWTRAVTTQHFILSIILGIRAVTAHDIVLNIVPSGYLAGWQRNWSLLGIGNFLISIVVVVYL
jgi:hypothetical protein